MYLLNTTYRYFLSTEVKTISRRGLHRPAINLQVHQKVGDFALQSIEQVEQGTSRNYKVYAFKHNSGLRYYHLDSSDILNTFALMVNHSPTDNRGASCVLERMIQCGDRKYKIKDAIEAMKDRSFNQTNDVQTTEDYYLFPFQTKCTKDFYNLLDVYLNMVYNPRLEYSDFLDCRGHFSLKNNSPEGYLSISGGVFEQSLLNQQLVEGQLNQVARKYFVNKSFSAIGKSHQIINLDYKDCLDYYRKNFSLKNSVLYTHGDLNPIRHIEAFDQFIRQLQNQASNTSQSSQGTHAYDLPQTVRIYHRQGQNNSFLLSFKLPANLSTEEVIQLNILSCLLFDFPESLFSKYLTVETPYPKSYGFRDFCFNIGFSTAQSINEYAIIQKQKMLMQDLEQIVKDGLDDGFIEAVMNNLQSGYYTNNGLTILQHISNELSRNKPFIQKLNIHTVFRKLQKDYRRKNVFENLIRKHLLGNNEYLRIVCEYQRDLGQKLAERNEFRCIERKKSLSQQELSNICNYAPTEQIQNPANLPIINSNDYQFFQQTNKRTKEVRGVKATFVEGSRLSEIVMKVDISDIDQEDINMLQLYCKILPRLGSHNFMNISYDEFISKYISDVSMEFSTHKQKEGLKLFLFLKVQFIDYNTEYAFNVLNNCLNHPNFNNFSRISEIIMAQSSRIYASISQESMTYGASYVCSQMNPFLKLQDKLFHARSFASVAADILKIANPRHILEYISKKMEIMHSRIRQTKRYQVFVKGPPDIEPQMDRYLDILLDTKEGQSVDKINIDRFMPSKIRTYFPNFKDGMAFQGFSVPYLEQESPAIALLGVIIHSNIQKHKKVGGCYVYKGGLVSYLKGGLKEFLALQRFYQDIHQVETGKRRLFQRFNSHTAYEQFKYGFSRDFVKHYKQAILATELSDIRHVLHKYIFQPLKEQKNSQVMMGPHVADYTTLMKTGWTIQRILEDMSLSMESNYSHQVDKLPNMNALDVV